MNNNDTLNQNSGNMPNMNVNYNNSYVNNQNVSMLNNNFPNNPAPNNAPKSEFKKKIFLIIVGILLLVAVALFIGYKFLSNKNDKVKAIFNDDALIRVEKDDKYGYINTKGKFVLEPIYEEASDFQGDYAIVKTTENIEGIEHKLYEIIDKKGNVKIKTETYHSIEYVPEYNIWVINNKLYNSTLNKISSDDIEVRYEKYGYLSWEDVNRKKAGIMNASGKITYTYEYQNNDDYFTITPSDIDSPLTERYCITNVDNEKYGIVNCDNGKMIYNYTENYISDEDNNIFQVNKKEPYEFVTLMYIQNNKIAYQTNSENVNLYSYISSGYIEIYDGDKDYDHRYSYIDIKTGNISSTFSNDSDMNINLDEWENLTGITKKSCSNGYGLVKGEKEILPCEWQSIEYFDSLLYQYLTSKGKNYVMAERDNKTYIVDLKNGKAIAEFNATYIYDNATSTFLYYIDNSAKEKIIYNLITGKTMKTSNDNSLSVYSNYITIKGNNKKNYYNMDLELIYSEDD